MAVWLDWYIEMACSVRVEDIARSKASFCGLGGIGGAGALDNCVGIGFSKGDVRRSSGGLAFDGCCVL